MPQPPASIIPVLFSAGAGRDRSVHDRDGAIIQLPQWLHSPVGQVLLEWEQRHLDRAVADLFGFHALQLGLPSSPRCAPTGCRTAGWRSSLRAARGRLLWQWRMMSRQRPGAGGAPASAPRSLRRPRCAATSTPCRSTRRASTSSFCRTRSSSRATRTWRCAVERVLVPEGRAIIIGFNPASMWGARQQLGRLRRSLAPDRRRTVPAHAGEFIGYRRLRDWLRLLSFEVEAGRFSSMSRRCLGAQCLALRLDGARRRPLVAGVRRALLHRCGQARARHAAGRADPERGAGQGAVPRRRRSRDAAPAPPTGEVEERAGARR